MTPAEALALYRSSLLVSGESVTLRTFAGTGPTRVPTDTTVRARVRGYQPAELVGEIDQGDREVIVLADDVATAPKKGDQIVVRGRTVSIEAVDDSTRRIAGTVIAYVIRTRG